MLNNKKRINNMIKIKIENNNYRKAIDIQISCDITNISDDLCIHNLSHIYEIIIYFFLHIRY